MKVKLLQILQRIEEATQQNIVTSKSEDCVYFSIGSHVSLKVTDEVVTVIRHGALKTSVFNETPPLRTAEEIELTTIEWYRHAENLDKAHRSLQSYGGKGYGFVKESSQGGLI